MSPFGKQPDHGPGTDGTAPVDPATSPDTEPDTDAPPTEPSPDASEVDASGQVRDDDTPANQDTDEAEDTGPDVHGEPDQVT